MVQSMNRFRHVVPLRLSAWIVAIAVILAFNGWASAEPGYSFAATPGKLPKTVVPTHYAIELEPNLDNLTIAGTEVIDIDVRETTEDVGPIALGHAADHPDDDVSVFRAALAQFT